MSTSQIRLVDVASVRQIGRRFTKTVLIVQATVVVLTAVLFSLSRLDQAPSPAMAVLIIVTQYLSTAALLIGVPAIVIGPMIVVFACAWTMESRSRTALSVSVSVLLSAALVL